MSGSICGACNSENATFKCGGCKQVAYCNRKCQRIDWKSHKTTCKFRSCIGSIHKKLDETHCMVYDNNKSERIKVTTHEGRKTMLDILLDWHDNDKDNGLNFDEFRDLMRTISGTLTSAKKHFKSDADTQWNKWCNLCHKFGFSDPKIAVIKKEEIWSIFYELATINVASKHENNNEMFKNVEHTEEIYTHAYELLTIVFHELKDLLVKPFTKTEISDAIISVTPIVVDVAWIISEYLSEIDTVFKIGSDREHQLEVEWCHDSANTKPMKDILDKYQKKYTNKVGEKRNRTDEKSYKYHVTFLHEIADAYNENGKLAGQHNLFEISIRIKDDFKIVENKRKKHTFLLGTCHAAKLSLLCRLIDHVELIECVLMHHGLDPANMTSMYVGKKIYMNPQNDIRKMEKLQKKLVKEFNRKCGSNARWMDGMMAKIEGIFEEDAFNVKRPDVEPPTQNDNMNFNFADLFAGLI